MTWAPQYPDISVGMAQLFSAVKARFPGLLSLLLVQVLLSAELLIYFTPHRRNTPILSTSYACFFVFFNREFSCDWISEEDLRKLLIVSPGTGECLLILKSVWAPLCGAMLGMISGKGEIAKSIASFCCC